MPDRVVTQLSDGVLQITISRTEKKNALDEAAYEALVDAFERAQQPDVHSIILTGAGGVFTAGHDLAEFAANPPRDYAAPVYRFLQSISTFEKPIVAAVPGPAIGIGTTMLLHCDLVYASREATFALPFVQLGLCPEGGSSYLLPRAVGLAKAREWLMLGETFGTAEALEAGLINGVAPADELLPLAQQRAEQLAGLSAESLKLTKRLLRRGHAQVLREVLQEEASHFLSRLQSDDVREAMAAFLQRSRGGPTGEGGPRG